ncbi:MAG TPA: hypothetical protein O0X64_03185 [Methanocorpusculum sp.]|nr:hypothetical protein [Methanocorpusculum sp.]
MKTKMFVLGLVPCVYACQNSEDLGRDRSCEEGYKVWTKKEDRILEKYVKGNMDEKGRVNWKKVEQYFPGRTTWSCRLRAKKLGILDYSVHCWTEEEDEILKDYVEKNKTLNGLVKWEGVEEYLPSRSIDSCRVRAQTLELVGDDAAYWKKEENQRLYEKHEIFGNDWVAIAKFFPNMTSAQCKNHWNNVVRKQHGYKTAKFQYRDVVFVIPQETNNVEEFDIIADSTVAPQEENSMEGLHEDVSQSSFIVDIIDSQHEGIVWGLPIFNPQNTLFLN